MKILMVCLGNICRSPIAEGILKSKIEKHGLPWTVDSAGTSSWHSGEQPDNRAIAITKKYGVDITYQKARQFSPYDFEKFDRIYAMDAGNYRDILRLALTDDEKQKVEMILNESFPGMNKQVPDPYWNDNGFDEVYKMLDEACEAVVKKYAVNV
ncbi:MAG: low molecular weight protein-tyrosine-phosphatase [Chitinophagales bacterium]|nr:low molecular weight protein-tyrosine-phosphatase [Chitinophagales bacterium]